ncbi:MAG: Rid family detoxifying hydrolase [candidate division WOR-3 bacterium]|nr:Rid family detoxifying hydrolase [candidate division WOR-3 bacterium]MCX7837681.1 Rid family detoxifying hydrolase [candidate division WOR-3 bacterium]MDW8113412.1 Rid family detoxifying hydrolase [candidate division WOR-3 bacterium]
MKEIIYTNEAPEPIGPYSQAVKIGNLLFLSGQIGINPKTNELVSGGIEQETRQIFENIIKILNSVKADLSNVLKVNIYLKNLEDFKKVNEIYQEYFKKSFPARTTIGGVLLPKNALIEIDVIAYLP